MKFKLDGRGRKRFPFGTLLLGVTLLAGCNGLAKTYPLNSEQFVSYSPTDTPSLCSARYTSNYYSPRHRRGNSSQLTPNGFVVAVSYMMPSDSAIGDVFGSYPMITLSQSLSNSEVELGVGISVGTASYAEDSVFGGQDTLDMTLTTLDFTVRKTLAPGVFAGGGLSLGTYKTDFKLIFMGPTAMTGSGSSNILGGHLVIGVIQNGFTAGLKYSYLAVEDSDGDAGGIQAFAGYRF